MKTGLRYLAIVLAGLTTLPTVRAEQSLTVTVAEAGQQVFTGIGIGLLGGDICTHAKADEVQRLLFEDLNTRYLRLWFRPAKGIKDPDGSPSPERFREEFVDSGVIRAARAHGVQKILVTPTGMRTAPNLPEFADYATFFQDLKEKHDTVIDATSVQNEPDTQGWLGAPAVAAVNEYRAQLDQRGLSDMAIVALDSSNADGKWAAATRALKNAGIWGKIGAISTHSYTMAATDKWGWSELAKDKEWWQTEAGWQGPNFSSVASRFLNDVNHGVGAWFWFIGAHRSDLHGAQNKHRLVILNDDGTYAVTPSYYFLKQLSQAFPSGSVFHRVTADRALPTPEMTWTYGRRPAVNVAAAVDPRGKWRLGLTNFTQNEKRSEKDPAIKFYSPAEDFEIRVVIPELADSGRQVFQVWRTRENDSGELVKTLEQSAPIIFENGTAVVPVGPRELVTLVQE